MASGKTYTRIASQTVSGVSSVTFTNLPQNFTDLFVVGTGFFSTGSGTGSVSVRVGNGSIDAGTSYGDTELDAFSSTVASYREISANQFNISVFDGSVSTCTYNFMNYSNGSTFKTLVARGSASSYVRLAGGVWRSTSPINQIMFFNTAGRLFGSGTTFTIYGIECAKNPYAEGGDKVYTTGTHWVHEFYNSGLFVPRQNLTADYLVVAGGGGSSVYYAGGGGAGGLRCTVTASGGSPGTVESALSLSGNTGYAVVVGAGGTGSIADQVNGTNGSNSTFFTITSNGGGGGGANEQNGSSGGSGGGGGASGIKTTNGASGTANQGFAGGNSFQQAGVGPAGGGGGAGGVGIAGATNKAGNGGPGVTTSITGSSITYAGGGGGGITGSQTPGTGGSGGGGNGVNNGNGQNAISNTGGGGGGAGGGTGFGGNGGSGIVIVRYPV